MLARIFVCFSGDFIPHMRFLLTSLAALHPFRLALSRMNGVQSCCLLGLLCHVFEQGNCILGALAVDGEEASSPDRYRDIRSLSSIVFQLRREDVDGNAQYRGRLGGGGRNFGHDSVGGGAVVARSCAFKCLQLPT